MDFTRAQSFRVVFFTIASALILILNCAEIAPPPGGEVDKTSPFIIGSSPADGATGIPFDNQIIISLSERIEKPLNEERAIFISPRQKIKPDIKWQANQITITLFDTVLSDRTYVISLSADIKDLRKNPIDSAGVIAFSTGDKINSGQLRGTVYNGDKPAANLFVGLYDKASFVNERLIDSTYPDYIAQTNREGIFNFKYLPNREFRLIALEDKNRNELIDLEDEQFALTDRATIIGDEASYLEDLNCYLTSQDSLPPKIVSAGMTADKLIRISLNRAYPTDQFLHQPNILKLRSLTDSTILMSNHFMQATDELVSTMHFYLPEMKPDSYYVELYLDSIPKTFERLVIKEGEDNNPPQISKNMPDNKPVFVSDFELSLLFSEPIDTTKMTDESLILLGEDSARIEYSSRMINPFKIELVPVTVETGGSYKLLLTEFELYDLSGNAMGDSLTEYRFSILNPDSLGSISGQIEIIIPDKNKYPVQLEFVKLENQKSYYYQTDDSLFKADLPPGRYLINSYIDENDNNRFDRGLLYPFNLAETYHAHPDTISVRSRFETGDITIKFK